MKTVSINVYSFSELSEEAKQKALSKLADINFDYAWWDDIYEDAKCIGLKITSFDLDRNRHCKGEFLWDAKEVAKAIISEHGESCSTYETAKNFLKEIAPLYQKEENLDYRDYDLEGEISDLENEFLSSLCEDYSMILQRDYEYRYSEEAIIETIEVNEYEFTENGTYFKSPYNQLIR